ncbi:MAG: DinB family protein [Chitinophagaceae bacterium]|nr:MAG: DinB family protein [Chitinophagaceae bacterium]
MTITQHIAQQVRQLYFGGNWTEVSLREVLAGVGWQEALATGASPNSIAALTYHIHYYVAIQRRLLEAGTLDGRDSDAFRHPPIAGEADWQALLARCWSDAEALAALVEGLPDSRLDETFVHEKHGSWYRNLLGMIEHSYYHLGQIVLLKKAVAGTQS